MPAERPSWYYRSVPETDIDDALFVRPSARSQLPTLLLLTLIFCLYPALAAVGVFGAPLMVFGMVVFGVILVIGGVAALRARHAEWDLRLDASGLTVRGHRPVPWTDLAEVRVTGLQPQSVFPFSLGYQVVTIVGKPGVELPALPSTSFAGVFARRSKRMRERLYGTRLVVLPHTMNASTEAITRSVRRWSEVPVR